MEKGHCGLFLESGNTRQKNVPLTLKTLPEGIKVFSQWNAGLTSLNCTDTERFESKYSNKLFDYTWRANKICIQDDIAAVAYSDYTDLNKVVIQDLDGGLYQPWTVRTINYGTNQVVKLWDNLIFPSLSSRNIQRYLDTNPSILDKDNGGTADWSNLFIVVEFDGYYTDSSGNLTYDSVADGKMQVFKYDRESIDTDGTFRFLDTYYPVVLDNSLYGPLNYSNEFYSGISHARLNDSQHVQQDLVYLEEYEQQLRDFGVLQSSESLTYGFVGYRKITLIKYNPLPECGKVDIYTRLSGEITNTYDYGLVYSYKHGLKDNDAIDISEAVNINGKDQYLNGVKYIKVVSDNTFRLYNDSEFKTVTEIPQSYNPKARWVCIGNANSGTTPDGWKYKLTLTSPTGRNGYVLNNSTTVPTTQIVQSQFHSTNEPVDLSEVENYESILTLDYFSDGIYNNRDLITGEIPNRPVASTADTLWAGPTNMFKSYRFGYDIDFKKSPSGEYYLMVGEPGPQTFAAIPYVNTSGKQISSPQYNTASFVTADDYSLGDIIWPTNEPKGKIHLIKLSIDVDKNVTPTHVETLTAETSTQTIPISLYDKYSYRYAAAPIQSANSVALNSTNQEKSWRINPISSAFFSSSYWYGAYLYHLPKDYSVWLNSGLSQSFTWKTLPGYDNTTTKAYCPYFTNYGLPVHNLKLGFVNGSQAYVLDWNDSFYPYIDSFGRSVALGFVDNKFILATSSVVKTLLTSPTKVGQLQLSKSGTMSISSRENPSLDPFIPDSTYSNFDCGYVFVFTKTIGSAPGDTSSVVRVNRISSTLNDSTSGGIDALYDKAYKFAKTIKIVDNKLYFNETKATDFYDYRLARLNGQNPATTQQEIELLNLEPSKIYIYTYDGSTFVQSNVLKNQNNYRFTYDNNELLINGELPYVNGIYTSFNIKEETLKNNLEPCYRLSQYQVGSSTTYNLSCIVIPTDGFGEYFDVGSDFLATNSLDMFNEIGVEHSYSNYTSGNPLLVNDYVHIYEQEKGTWKYIAKIAPSFDFTDDKYGYDTLVENTDCVLRDLGNYNYSNLNLGSKTWDISLDKRYVIADDRIILKDPTTYSIFRKNLYVQKPSQEFDEYTEACTPYFKYDEIYTSQYNRGLFDTVCNFYHTKLEYLYKYSNDSIVTNQYSTDGLDALCTSPVFFYSVPRTSSNSTNTKIVVNASFRRLGGTSDIKLKLLPEDPRRAISADYINNFTYSCSQQETEFLYSDTNPSGQKAFSNGVLDIYGDILSAVSTTVDGDFVHYTFEIPANLLLKYILPGKQTVTLTRTSNGETLVLADTTQITYKSSVDVENTILFSFLIEDDEYAIPSFGADNSLELSNIEVLTTVSRLTNILYDARTYNCIFDKTISYLITSVAGACEDLPTSNLTQIIGIGTSLSPTRNCGGYGESTRSYQLFSIDSIYDRESINVTNASVVKSFDIQKLDYLPITLRVNESLSNDIPLLTSGGNKNESTATLFTQSSYLDDAQVDLFLGPSNYKLDTTLYMKVPNVVIEPNSGTKTSQMNLVVFNATRLVGTSYADALSLNIETADLDSNATLVCMAPIQSTGTMNLVYPKAARSFSQGAGDTPTLYTFGTGVLTGTANLVTSGNTPVNIPLNISGPLTSTSGINAFIESDIQGLTGTTNLTLHQQPNNNFVCYISGPSAINSTSTLFTKYTPTSVNSISNGGTEPCYASRSTVPFDITQGTAETLIEGSNSICKQNYAPNATVFGTQKKTIDILDITKEYDFYRYGREVDLVDWNSDYLIVGIIEDKRPKILVFSLFNNQVTYINKLDPYIGLFDSSVYAGDSHFNDLKIANGNRIAISAYIERSYGNGPIFGVIEPRNEQACCFDVSVLTIDGISLVSDRRFLEYPTEQNYLDNAMGLSLLFSPIYADADESLYYTKESGYDTNLIYRRYDEDYTIEHNLPAYSLFKALEITYGLVPINNISSGKVPFNRSAYGHKIVAMQNNENFIIAAPLHNRYLLTAQTTNKNTYFHGTSFVFDGDFAYDSVRTSGYTAGNADEFYGYETSGENGHIKYSSSFIKGTTYAINIEDAFGAAVVEHTSTDKNFIDHNTFCGKLLYTVLDNKIYNLNGFSYEFPASLRESEVRPYISPAATIKALSEVVYAPKIKNGQFIVSRSFDVEYGVADSITIDKLTLLNSTQQFTTPTLFMKNNGLSKGVDLFYKSAEPFSQNTTLTLEGVFKTNNFFTLHAECGLRGGLPLIAKSRDPESLDTTNTLYIYGSTQSGSFYKQNDATFVINADYTKPEQTLPLVIILPSIGYNNNYAPLTIGNFAENLSGSLSINLLNSQVIATGSRNLTIKAVQGSSANNSGNTTLYLYRKGSGGGEELIGQTTIVLNNTNKQSTIPVYIDGTNGQNGSFTLIFLPSKGVPEGTISLQAFGYTD